MTLQTNQAIPSGYWLSSSEFRSFWSRVDRNRRFIVPNLPKLRADLIRMSVIAHATNAYLRDTFESKKRIDIWRCKLTLHVLSNFHEWGGLPRGSSEFGTQC